MPPKQLQGSEQRRCSHCGSSHSSSHWKKHPTSGQQLCNACCKYAQKHGGQLPPDSVLQRRPAEPRRLGTKEEMAQRRCLQCGSASPGNGQGACWRRNPATGEEWVCAPCYSRIGWQLKQRSDKQRQRRHRQRQTAARAHSQQEHSNDGASSEEGEQAPAAQPTQRQRPKRKRQQEEHRPKRESVPASHGAASAAKKRARGKQQAEASDGGVPARRDVAEQDKPPASPTGSSGSGASRRGLNTCRCWHRSRRSAPPRQLPPRCLTEKGSQPAARG